MVVEKRFILTLAFILISPPQEAAHADNFYKEGIVISGYSDKEQWLGKKGGIKNSVGYNTPQKLGA